MDFFKKNQSIEEIIKSAGVENGTASKYTDINPIEQDREDIVSHLKHKFQETTGNVLAGREFELADQTNKNLLISATSQSATIKRKIKEVQVVVDVRKDELKKAKENEEILMVFALIVGVIVVLYLIGSNFSGIHIVAIFVGIAGVVYLMYLRSPRTHTEPHIPPKGNNKWWISTTLGL